MTRPSPPSERNFGLWFAVLCGIAGIKVDPRWLGAGVALVIVSFVAPALLRPFNLLWFRFGLAVGKVMNPLVMALVYCVAIIPIGLLWKVTGRDPLRLRLDSQATSYWISRSDKPQSMLRQF